MQKYFVLALFAFLNVTTANAAIKANCSDKTTFLKINEVRLNENGQRVAELYMNFKELNRILNLPEVILQPDANGITVKEADGNSLVILNFVEASEVKQDTELQTEVSVSVAIDGKKIRENIKLKCEK